MKTKIAILTDSSSSLYTVNHKYDNLFMINLPCFIGDEMFTNFEENGDGPFYEALANTDLIAKTSQPSVGETIVVFEKIKSLGYTDIIYLPISKELSGTYENGHLAKGMVEGINVEVVSTLTTVSILSRMALTAAEMANKGSTVEEILDRIESLKKQWGYYITVGDLTALVKNGRLSNPKSFIANLLKIKPVIKFNQEGKLIALKNVRHFNRAIKQIVETVVEEVNAENGEIHIAYTNNTEDVEFVKELIKEKLPNAKIEVYTLPATVVAHVGLKAIGVGYINNN
ncbi:MAG TPA: DegV family protein [Acholeplasmataceae bacterium]|nr:DegV family protein [Acholeplasmataceae bacterium]